MLRADNRSASSLRPISITVESLDRVDGSSAFSFGETKALASVSGPIQVRLTSELPSKASFEVILRPLSGIPGTESKSLAATIRALLAPSLVLTQNPRTLIQLVIQSLTPSRLHKNPSLTAAFINASTLALLRAASFPMLGVVCASAVGRVRNDETHRKAGSERLLMDPSLEELQQCDAMGCVAVIFGGPASANVEKSIDGIEEANNVEEVTGRIVWSSFQGAPLQSDYDAILRLARSGAGAVYRAIRHRLREELVVTAVGAEQTVKKMPKHKGGRVALNVGTDDAMDTT